MTFRDLWVLMNVYHPSLSNTKFSDNALSEFMSAFISRMRIRCHQMPVKKSDFWSRFLLSDQAVPISKGGNRRRIYLKIE